ncbi:MAG: SUMF1/EgtB/PvdO family nonheme iron enzyme, partial [Okeania sp. SIO2D1]|nr:SUMF1/EgtB/PvdO family nonheme iron enzyme [Okeania sp. SIO2D1]
TLTVAVGTPGYMPSEQAIGKPKLSSDIYAVGMVGIKALTGKDPHNLPTDTKTGNIIWRNEAQVTNHLANILDRMVHEYFPQRYENSTEVLEALGLTTSPQPTPTPTPIPVTKPAKIVLASTSNTNISIQKFKTVTVNTRGEIKSHRQHQAEVMKENLGNGVFLEMVKIPAGRFLMGSPETEPQRRDSESPQHYVEVPEFFIGKYPVTQAQWQAVIGNTPSSFKGANRPVEKVNWYEATEFCQKLSDRTGKKYSLPSESQWEYACRAGTTTPFYFGETITSELANYGGTFTYTDEPEGKYRGETTDVGIFPPNAFGLYDMHGNVWEWCADDWHDNYNGAPTDGSAWLDGNEFRSPLRGGSWYNNPLNCRSALRYLNYRRDNHYILIGFRVVCDARRTL